MPNSEAPTWTRLRPGLYESSDGAWLIERNDGIHDWVWTGAWIVTDGEGEDNWFQGFETLAEAKAAVAAR